MLSGKRCHGLIVRREIGFAEDLFNISNAEVERKLLLLFFYLVFDLHMLFGVLFYFNYYLL